MKRPWRIWIIALLFIFIYAMGIYDFFMMLSHNAAYYSSHGYGENVIAYFSNYPVYFLVFWVGNLLCGFAAPILLLLKKAVSKQIALVSAMSDFLLLILTFMFRDRWNVLGAHIAAFDAFILLMTFGLYLYCVYMEKSGAFKNGRID